MLASIPSRLAACLILSALSSALVGCKPATTPQAAANQTPDGSSLQSPAPVHRPPGTAELTSFVRGNLPPVLRLVDLKNDPPVRLPNSAPGSDAWIFNVRLTFAPVEDELGPPPPQEAQTFQALTDELGGLAAWSQAYAQSPYTSLYPGFTVEAPVPPAPQLLRVLHAKDRPRPPIYGKMAAEWQVDHWQYTMEDVTMPADEGGKFRSEYTGPILIQGDPATDRFVASVKAAIAQAKPKRQAIEAAYQEDLRKATQPGTLYKGSISFGSNTMPAEVRFVTPSSGDPSFARFEMRLPATGYVYVVSAKLAPRVPNLPLVSTGTTGVAPEQAEPTPQADLTISYEQINVPKPFPQNPFATDFYYHAHDTRSGSLNLRNHQLKGKAAVFLDGPGFVLSVQQVP